MLTLPLFVKEKQIAKPFMGSFVWWKGEKQRQVLFLETSHVIVTAAGPLHTV